MVPTKNLEVDIYDMKKLSNFHNFTLDAMHKYKAMCSRYVIKTFISIFDDKTIRSIFKFKAKLTLPPKCLIYSPNPKPLSN